nr:putative cyclin-dependent serine/threonine-protein kinase DDB_G0272797/DDB_G0274007 [Arachis hypogaea]
MEGMNEEDDHEEVVAPRQRRSQREEGQEQAHGAIDMSQLQKAIEELYQQLMQAQQEQYPEHQEQYLRDKEEREAWQRQMEEKQESWQQQMMTQQQEFEWKNIYHTMGEVRHVQQVENDENIQARLEYLTHNLPALNPQIKPFEQCQEFRDRQQVRYHHYTEVTLHRLEEVGLSRLLDSVWDRRCPGEEAQDYSKLGKRKKKKGESSRSQEHNH